MIQGVQIDNQYIGLVETLPNGKYRAWSEPCAMATTRDSYSEAVFAVARIAELCGIEGTLRTPEHRMVF